MCWRDFARAASWMVNGFSCDRYNPQGDMATANAIAKEVTSGNYDLILSVSTASLQTIANANRFAAPPRKHVFGITSDPWGAGVGISRENHAEHPPYMTGLGTLPPVAEAFRLAKELKPDLRRVGLVWNPAEANSVAATALAREICRTLGITLVEANAENATAAGEAAASVLSRGIDALWVSPDVTVVTAIDVLLAAVKRARVAMFTSLPGYAEKGALFDLGADYRSIGRVQGELAADVLDGRDPGDGSRREHGARATARESSCGQRARRSMDDSRRGLETGSGRVRQRWQARERSAVGNVERRHPKRRERASMKPLARRMTVDLIEYVDSPNAEIQLSPQLVAKATRVIR